jgi:PAS domain S-box-containing protein
MAFKSSRKKNQAVNIEHERLTTLINSMADAVIALDEEARVVKYNAAALNILDINNLKLNTHLETVFKPIDKNNQHVSIKRLVLSTKVPVTTRDLRLAYEDGSTVNLYISVAPVRLSYGTRGQRGYVVLLRDITREKSLEEERDEFISVTSHELRTPIAIAEGNLSNAIFMAGKTEVPDNIKQALTSAHEQVLFLADLINDLSTLSRAERGALQVDVASFSIKELVYDLVNSYKAQAEKQGLSLNTEVDETLANLSSSKLYVREVLQNFVTNAIKYTHEGSVTLKAEPSLQGVKFSVTDTGIGISKSDQEKVFDKFFRSEDYRTRQSNGTGLGLYVTIKLARLIHAEISLTSELNQGSTFTILVPNLAEPA